MKIKEELVNMIMEVCRIDKDEATKRASKYVNMIKYSM